MDLEGAGCFEWDRAKDKINREKHGIGSEQAQKAFFDPQRRIMVDDAHSVDEPRLFCLGMVEGWVMTVRFTYREGRIRILGAGYWRKGQRAYGTAKG